MSRGPVLVAVLGAESSGKSTLGQALAAATGEPYVEEVGRTLWVAAGGDLPLEEYVTICREHVALEEAARLRARRFVFVDTHAITTQQYAFFFFGQCPPEVQAYADRCRARYAHTIVCAPDFAFHQDGHRVHPQVQQYMDGAIRNDLTIRSIPYTVVGGSVEARVEQVLRAIGA
jgi:nicotinamide riboside kinase